MVRRIIGRIVLLAASVAAGAGINHVTEDRPSWDVVRSIEDDLAETKVRSKARLCLAETEAEQARASARDAAVTIEDLRKEVKDLQKEVDLRDANYLQFLHEICIAIDRAAKKDHITVPLGPSDDALKSGALPGWGAFRARERK